MENRGARERVTGAVIAGGSGTRMGTDKRAIEVDGVPMLRRVVVAVASVVDDVVVSCRRDAPPSPSILESLDVRLVFDTRPESGPLAGIESVLTAAATDFVLVVAADLPWVDPAVLRLLVDEARSHPEAEAVALATDRGPQPLLAAYRRASAGVATRLLDTGERRARAFLGALGVRELPSERWRAADPSGRSARNVNVPADLR